MLESAGRACPDKDQLARDCSKPAMEEGQTATDATVGDALNESISEYKFGA